MVLFTRKDEQSMRDAWSEGPLEGILHFYELQRAGTLREKFREKWEPKVDLAYQIIISEDASTERILGRLPPLTDVESDTLTVTLGDQTRKILETLASDGISSENTKQAYNHAQELVRAAQFTANIYHVFNGRDLNHSLRLAIANAEGLEVATYVKQRSWLWYDEDYQSRRDEIFPLGSNFKVLDDSKRPRVLVYSVANKGSIGVRSSDYGDFLRYGKAEYYQSELKETTIDSHDAETRIEVIRAIESAFVMNQKDNSYDPKTFQPIRVNDSLRERVNKL